VPPHIDLRGANSMAALVPPSATDERLQRGELVRVAAAFRMQLDAWKNERN
jgi:hypothetical protein